MTQSSSEDLFRGHQADRRPAAQRWTLARDARAARPGRRTPNRSARMRTGTAEVLRALARRLEAGGSAAC
jgi:hypothetical protein